MTHIDLFSGIGGFSIAAELSGFRTIGFSEINPYACKVLERHWPDVPNYGDIRTFPTIKCDLVTGGFPCQPFSVAGHQRGQTDNRYLWPSMLDVVERCEPAYFLGENVPGIIGMELDRVLADLESIGFWTQPIVVPACAVGAPHKRDRVWILAHSKRRERWHQPHDGATGRMGRNLEPNAWHRKWESALRDFRGMDDGLSYGVDRVDCIRNSIVPQVAEVILKALVQIHGNGLTASTAQAIIRS